MCFLCSMSPIRGGWGSLRQICQTGSARQRREYGNGLKIEAFDGHRSSPAHGRSARPGCFAEETGRDDRLAASLCEAVIDQAGIVPL